MNSLEVYGSVLSSHHRMLCQTNCTNVDKLAMSIAKAGEKPVMQASAVEIKPAVAEAVPQEN